MDLIIDTSSEKLKVIISDKTSFLENESSNPKHLKHLLPQIDNLLSKKNATLADITNYCVVVGPGSFTGVRIGVSTIKAFSAVYKNSKILAINMLELLKHKINKQYEVKNNFCIAIKSTSTKFYVLFKGDDDNNSFSKMLTKDELERLIGGLNVQFYSFIEEFSLGEKTSVRLDLESKDYIEYVELLKQQNLFVKERDLKPVYMALSQAEEELAKKERLNNA